MTHPIHPTALFRLSVLGPLASRNSLEHGELKKIVRELASKTYSIPNSKHVYLSSKTIERWYYQWHKHGIDGLMPKSRKDKGNSKLPADIQQLLIELKKDNPARSLNTLLRLAQMQGKGKLVRSSVYRLLKHHNRSRRSASDTVVVERRAFEALFAGDIWYGDVMHGPSIQTPQGKQKTYLVSVMDDASRLICHSAFCFDETALSIEYVLKQALLKRGLPKRFVIDNGPAYRAETLQSICARLEIRLIYCRPYEPEGKGKLERYHRTYNDKLYEVSFEYVGQHVYLVIDPHEQKAKWIESLSYERLGPIHPLDKQANINRKRRRPIAPSDQEAKTSLVEVAYQQTANILNLTKETK